MTLAHTGQDTKKPEKFIPKNIFPHHAYLLENQEKYFSAELMANTGIRSINSSFPRQ